MVAIDWWWVVEKGNRQSQSNGGYSAKVASTNWGEKSDSLKEKLAFKNQSFTTDQHSHFEKFWNCSLVPRKICLFLISMRGIISQPIISKSSGKNCFESLKHTSDRGNKDIFSWTIPPAIKVLTKFFMKSHKERKFLLLKVFIILYLNIVQVCVRDTTGALMSFQIDPNTSVKELQRAFELEFHFGFYHTNKSTISFESSETNKTFIVK